MWFSFWLRALCAPTNLTLARLGGAVNTRALSVSRHRSRMLISTRTLLKGLSAALPLAEWRARRWKVEAASRAARHPRRSEPEAAAGSEAAPRPC